jgi:hypothetical protein
METKQIKIEVPKGYEIDKEKSTFENIILKPIEKKLPLSVDEIPNLDATKYTDAFQALRQLVHLRDAWNGDWRADWKNKLQRKHVISLFMGNIEISEYGASQYTLHFKTEELAEKFLEQFNDLINEAKELL